MLPIVTSSKLKPYKVSSITDCRNPQDLNASVNPVWLWRSLYYGGQFHIDVICHISHNAQDSQSNPRHIIFSITNTGRARGTYLSPPDAQLFIGFKIEPANISSHHWDPKHSRVYHADNRVLQIAPCGTIVTSPMCSIRAWSQKHRAS